MTGIWFLLLIYHPSHWQAAGICHPKQGDFWRALLTEKEARSKTLNVYHIVQGLPDYAGAKAADTVLQHQRNWEHSFSSLAFHFSRMDWRWRQFPKIWRTCHTCWRMKHSILPETIWLVRDGQNSLLHHSLQSKPYPGLYQKNVGQQMVILPLSWDSTYSTVSSCGAPSIKNNVELLEGVQTRGTKTTRERVIASDWKKLVWDHRITEC